MPLEAAERFAALLGGAPSLCREHDLSRRYDEALPGLE
jgi:hypothetical protein